MEAFRRNPEAFWRLGVGGWLTGTLDKAGTSCGIELHEELAPFVDVWQYNQTQQRVVQFIGIANVGPGFSGYVLYGFRIEGPCAARYIAAQSPAQLDGPCAPLCQGRVIQISVGIGV